MKKLFLLLGVVGTLFMTSCDFDDEDEYTMENFWLSSGTVTKQVGTYFITTDEGKKLWPSASKVSESLLEHGMRVLVNYTILGDASEGYDYYIKINDISQILTKPVFEFTSETPQNVIDSIGNDPVTILDTWFTNDYLNVEFEYGGGATIHFINLVFDEDNPETDNGEVILELKHNSNSDPYNYKQWGIASFDVSKFKKDTNEPVEFFVTGLGAGGEMEYNKIVIYDYDDSEMSIESKAFDIGGVLGETK